MVAVSICGHSLNTDRKPSMFGDETIPMYGAEDGADIRQETPEGRFFEDGIRARSYVASCSDQAVSRDDRTQATQSE